MLKSQQYRRLLWLSLLVVLAYCGLGWRLVDLQVFSAGMVRQEFEKNEIREYIEPAKRGDILDSRGTTLTASIQRFNIGAEPPQVAPYQAQVAAAIAGPLGLDAKELTKLLTPITNKIETGKAVIENRFVMLKKGATYDEWAKVREIMQHSDFGLDLEHLSNKEVLQLRGLRRFGVRIDSQYQERQYPNGPVAGQILGYVGNQEREYSIGGKFTEQVGLAGIERAFNEQLEGAPGFRRVVQTKLTDDQDQHLAPSDGLNVILTIDRRVQEILDRTLAEAQVEVNSKDVFGTVMNVNTGEILAMSSAPLFSPGDRSHFDPETVRLRPILDEYEPGSIFKVIAISGALQDGAVDLSTQIDCLKGRMPVPGMAALTDHEPFDILSVEAVITKSSNIGTAQIVRRDGHDRFYHWLLQYGIGTRTGVGLREGSGGLRPRSQIYPGEFTRLPIGYGLKVTQLQLASIYSAIANGGVLMQPRLISRLETRDGRVIAQYKPEAVRRVVTKETSRKMIEALRTVPQPGGTAVEAAMDYHTVAGKTGTAHKYNVKLKRYDQVHYYASFIGFFPATNPQICIAITVDEPDKTKGHYGGKTAGPIFKKVAEQTAFQLHIKPDREPDTAPSRTPAENQALLDDSDPDLFLFQPVVGASARPAAPTGLRISSSVGEANY